MPIGLPERELLMEDRNARIARLDALGDANLEDLENLLGRSAGFQRVPDASPRAVSCRLGAARAAGRSVRFAALDVLDQALDGRGRRPEGAAYGSFSSMIVSTALDIASAPRASAIAHVRVGPQFDSSGFNIVGLSPQLALALCGLILPLVIAVKRVSRAPA
jgi:hypothetical protein